MRARGSLGVHKESEVEVMSLRSFDVVPHLAWATYRRREVFECAPLFMRYARGCDVLKTGGSGTDAAALRALEELKIIFPHGDRYAVRNRDCNVDLLAILFAFHVRRIPYRVVGCDPPLFDRFSEDKFSRKSRYSVEFESDAFSVYEFAECIARAGEAGIGPLIQARESSVDTLLSHVYAPTLSALFADLPAAGQPGSACPEMRARIASVCGVFRIFSPCRTPKDEGDLRVSFYLAHSWQTPEVAIEATLALHKEHVALGEGRAEGGDVWLTQ